MTTHFNHKKLINIHFAADTRANEQQKLLGEMYPQQALPALQQILEELGNDSSISLDMLEIDLEKFSPTASQEEVKALVRQHLQQHLQTAASQGRQSIKAREEIEGLEVVGTFLQQGVLPWYCKPEKGFDLARLLNDLYQKQPLGILNTLQKVLLGTSARQRFINFFSPKEGFTWVLRFIGQKSLRESDLLEEWIKLLQQRIFSVSQSRQLLELLLKEVVVADEHTAAIPLLARQFLLLRNKEPRKLNLLLDHLLSFKPSLQQADQAMLRSSADAKGTLPAELRHMPEDESSAPEEPLEDSRMPIINAGMVLLHAFLKPYLLKVMGIDEDKMAMPEHKAKAVQLLHFICTGQSGTPEYELVFNKILCGLPLYYPVPPKLHISHQIRKETNELLKVLITHWSILKSNSVANLRSSFLLRQGLLERVDGGWLLRIEKKPYDLLLDHLPWGIQQFTTPFDKQLISVEW